MKENYKSKICPPPPHSERSLEVEEDKTVQHTNSVHSLSSLGSYNSASGGFKALTKTETTGRQETRIREIHNPVTVMPDFTEKKKKSVLKTLWSGY